MAKRAAKLLGFVPDRIIHWNLRISYNYTDLK